MRYFQNPVGPELQPDSGSQAASDSMRIKLEAEDQGPGPGSRTRFDESDLTILEALVESMDPVSHLAPSTC